MALHKCACSDTLRQGQPSVGGMKPFLRCLL